MTPPGGEYSRIRRGAWSHNSTRTFETTPPIGQLALYRLLGQPCVFGRYRSDGRALVSFPTISLFQGWCATAWRVDASPSGLPRLPPYHWLAVAIRRGAWSHNPPDNSGVSCRSCPSRHCGCWHGSHCSTSTTSITACFCPSFCIVSTTRAAPSSDPRGKALRANRSCATPTRIFPPSSRRCANTGCRPATEPGRDLGGYMGPHAAYHRGGVARRQEFHRTLPNRTVPENHLLQRAKRGVRCGDGIGLGPFL